MVPVYLLADTFREIPKARHDVNEKARLFALIFVDERRVGLYEREGKPCCLKLKNQKIAFIHFMAAVAFVQRLFDTLHL